MSSGLPVSGVVNVEVIMSPMAAKAREFGNVLAIGDSDVININERIRFYTGIKDIANDFGLDAPEYEAAKIFFSQNPSPNRLYIGRFASQGTSAVLSGGILTEAQKQMSNFTSITDGSFKVTVDTVEKEITGLDFSGKTNINGVASVINAKLSAFASCVFDGEKFVIKTTSTGATAKIGYGSAASTGTDISTLIAITESLADVPAEGIAAESPLECIQALSDVSGEWYMAAFASAIADDDHVAVAGYIEATTPYRIYGVTTADTKVINATATTDIASRLSKLNYKRTLVQYSTKSPCAVFSVFGRMSTVKFLANQSTITLKFKQLPGVEAENLTSRQNAALAKKHANVFVNFDNDTAILQEGVMSNGYFIDEVHGLDWLQNFTQNKIWNLLYQSTTKVPQTNAGVTRIINKITESFEQGITNGLMAPGRWNADGFGALGQGEMLTTGYYIYAPAIEDQDQSEREQRKAPVLQCAVKLAGAIHFADVVINVNR